MTIPFLILIGEKDQFAPSQELSDIYKVLPNATIVSLPNMNHDQLFVQSDIVLPHIKEFLARVSKK
jgi:pimeloyl-ACP methyl ester carboxylesterase